MEAIWPGSGSAVSNSTPFGLYDNDTIFQSDAPKFAKWCAQRLGYPIMAVELQDIQFYTCFEESITVNIQHKLINLILEKIYYH